MDLLEFTNNSYLMLTVYSLLGIILLFPLKVVGAFFLRDDQPITQAVIGISFLATLGAISSAYFAITTKYIIYGCIALSAVLFIGKTKIEEMKKYAYSFGIITILFLFFYIHYLFFIGGETDIAYNSHMPYFSDISFEIFQAEYWSRLRHYDAYPLEWTQYHLFSGILNGIPLAIFPDKSIVTLTCAKVIVLAYLCAAIYENLRAYLSSQSTNLIFCFSMILYFTIFQTYFIWSLRSNALAMNLFVLLAFFGFYRGNFLKALIFSMFYAVSVSRATVPGFFLSLFALFLFIKSNISFLQLDLKAYIKSNTSAILFTAHAAVTPLIGWKAYIRSNISLIFLAMTIAVAILTTIFSGTAMFSSAVSLFAKANFFQEGWVYLWPLVTEINAYEYLVVIIYFTIMASNLKTHIKQTTQLKYFYIGIGLLCVLLMILPPYLAHNARTRIYMYILPFICILCIKNKNIKIPFLVLYCGSFLQMFFFNVGVGASNFNVVALVFLFPLFEIFKSIKIPKNIANGMISMLIVCILFLNVKPIFGFSFSNDGWLKLIQLPEKELFIYKGEEDEMLARLYSLKGTRIIFHELRAKYANTQCFRFLNRSEEALEELKKLKQKNGG